MAILRFMAQSRPLKSDEFDSLIIGGSIAGLIAAHQLEGTGRKVALIEGLDSLGGSCRPGQNLAGAVDHGLKLIPDSDQNREIIEWLGKILGEPIRYSVVEAAPITFDEGKFKPFVGFGDQKVATAVEIDAYAKERYLRLETSPKNWVPRLIESFTGTTLLQSYVTKMQVDDAFVIELLINGSKRISGREVLFCATPQQLTKILPETHVPGKLRQRLLKGEFWTSVNLDLLHAGRVTDSEAVHVLKGANEEPSVGVFHAPVTLDDDRIAQLSQWMTLVPRDITDEPELVGSALKQIKRQVKRAYDTSLEGLLQERIIVNPTSHGDLSGALPEDGRWPKLQNLWVVSGLLDPARNLAGSLHQARRTIQSVAGEGEAALVSVESELSENPGPNA